MWHTLLDDPDSYLEASATCGFGYGILRGAAMGLAEPDWTERALRAVDAILTCTDVYKRQTLGCLTIRS